MQEPGGGESDRLATLLWLVGGTQPLRHRDLHKANGGTFQMEQAVATNLGLMDAELPRLHIAFMLDSEGVGADGASEL